MRRAVFFTIFVTLVAASELAVEAEWKQWRAKHKKHYSTHESESLKRTVWSKNKEYVEDHNAHAGEYGYTLAMNSFGDLVSVFSLLMSCISAPRVNTLTCMLIHCDCGQETFSTCRH